MDIEQGTDEDAKCRNRCDGQLFRELAAAFGLVDCVAERFVVGVALAQSRGASFADYGFEDVEGVIIADGLDKGDDGVDLGLLRAGIAGADLVGLVLAGSDDAAVEGGLREGKEGPVVVDDESARGEPDVLQFDVAVDEFQVPQSDEKGDEGIGDLDHLRERLVARQFGDALHDEVGDAVPFAAREELRLTVLEGVACRELPLSDE